MKKGIVFSILLLWSASGLAQPGQPSQQEVVFKGVNVIPMDTERILENQVVLVKGGKIVEIGKSVKYGKEALVIDGRGKYLIPGLAEMHAHVPPVDDLAPMKDVLVLYLVNGITTIRGMLGHPRHLELRSKIQSGEILGPKLYTAGPSLNGNSVKTTADAERMVREQRGVGFDFLKLHPGLTHENFDAIVKTAKEVGIPFAGHVSWDVGIWHAIESDYASVDHLDQMVEGLIPDLASIKEQEAGFMGIYVADRVDEKLIPKLMKGLVDHNIAVVPTQALAERWFSADHTALELSQAPEMKYMDEQTTKNWVNSKEGLQSNTAYNAQVFKRFLALRRKLILECQRSGVTLLLGSDAPQVFNVPGFSIHHELSYMVDAGLTPYEALRSGTVNVATYFRRSDSGTIKAGNASDLVLLAGNPLKDIHQTARIEGVMLGTKWIPKSEIESLLKSVQKK